MMEIRAFIVVLSILLLGFSMSLWLLMRDHPNTPENCGFALIYKENGTSLPEGTDPCATSYGDFSWFLASSISLGLFGEAMHEETPIHVLLNSDGTHAIPPFFKATFFLTFNFVTQVVLLNLLIALMGEARAHAAEEAAQNAFRRRAELVLEQVEDSRSMGGGIQARLRALLSRLFPDGPWSKAESVSRMEDARWLHVLVPDELEASMDAPGDALKDGRI